MIGAQYVWYTGQLIKSPFHSHNPDLKIMYQNWTVLFCEPFFKSRTSFLFYPCLWLLAIFCQIRSYFRFPIKGLHYPLMTYAPSLSALLVFACPWMDPPPWTYICILETSLHKYHKLPFYLSHSIVFLSRPLPYTVSGK